MIILESVIHKTIWGGDRLSKYVKSNDRKIGHLYLVNGRNDFSNKILNGIYKGSCLNRVFQKERKNWNLAQYEEFPLTIALVDATENLSIQVHPNSDIAKKLEKKSMGKVESWIFLEEPESKWIYAGCKCATKDELKRAIQAERLETIIERIPVKKNDYICLPAGTLHAMTAGGLVYEIEYGSDFTYRFYDYNRKDCFGKSRELHILKAFEAVVLEKNIKQINFEYDKWIMEQPYEVCRIKNISSYKNSSDELECVAILKGTGVCDDVPISSGMAIILFPGEILRDIVLSDIIIARLRARLDEKDEF